MPRCRLLALDLDGTLLRDDGDIALPDRQAVARAAVMGVRVVLATGRLPGRTLDIVGQLGLPGPVICADGGLIVDGVQGTALCQSALRPADRGLLMDIAEACELVPLFVSPGGVVAAEVHRATAAYLWGWVTGFQAAAIEFLRGEVESGLPASVGPLLVGFAVGSAAGVQRALKAVPALPHLVCETFPLAPDGPWALRLRPVTAEKGRALVWVARLLGIPRAQVAVVGDWWNDVSMFRWAPQSFAMAHAPEEVARIARHRLRASARTGGGVAEALARLFSGIEGSGREVEVVQPREQVAVLIEVRPAGPVADAVAVAGPAVLDLEWIEDVDRLHELRPQWSSLAQDAHGCSVFQRPEWLLPYLSHLGDFSDQDPVQLRSLAAWRGSRLCGLAVLQLSPAQRVLRFVGAPVTDRHGMLVARDADRDGHPVSRLLLTALLADPVWQRCELTELAQDDPLPDLLMDLLPDCLPAGCTVDRGEGEVCPYVTLAPADPARQPPRSDSFEGRLGRALRALRSEGPVSVEQAPVQEPGPFMDALFRLHAIRWQGRGEPGVLAFPPVQRFHREVARQMAQDGRLRLWGLRVGGTLQAIFYGFADGRTLTAYLGGFDPGLARYSPGLLVIWHALRAAAAEGLQELDFLRGGEAYKFRFGARRRHNQTLVINRP